MVSQAYHGYAMVCMVKRIPIPWLGWLHHGKVMLTMVKGLQLKELTITERL
jgi:hypothetical protein